MPIAKIKAVHSLQWIADLFQKEPAFFQKKMFGCEAICLDDFQVLVLAAKDEPWNGLLICTSREHHESLKREYRALEPHAVLGKWLYVSQSHSDFEEIAQALAGRAMARDPRIGVETKRKLAPLRRKTPRKRTAKHKLPRKVRD